MKRTASIIIPCWNEPPPNLGLAVQSALSQDYSATEVIVVDDGSTDSATVDALSSLDNARLIRQQNQGLGPARNTGIARATGHYIFPLDSDNWLEPDVITLLVARLEASSRELVAAYPRRALFGEQAGEAYVPSRVELPDLAYLNSVDAGALFRKEDWERAGGYVATNGPEDWIFWASLLRRPGNYMELVRPAILHYRVKPMSLNSKASSAGGLREARSIIAETMPEHASILYLRTAEIADRMRRMVESGRTLQDARATELLAELARRSKGIIGRVGVGRDS